jgi:predicted glutamine amidotransferase
MCVIICIEDGKYPSKSTLEDAESMNCHGGSIAWLDKQGRKYYQKGIKAKAITKIINKQLKPKGIKTAIIHFRIASVGNVNKKLCHPFEITSRVDLNLSGERMTTDLLFHNGTWTEYAEEMLVFLGKHSKPMTIPYGEFSDSRVMAYLAKRMGVKKMAKLVTGWNKIAVLTSEGINRYGTGWVKHKGNTCSNDYFVPTTNQWFNDDTPYTFAGYGVNDQDYLNEEEKKTVVKLKKDYDLSDDDINQYLDYGYSVDDIAFVVDQEIKEMKDVRKGSLTDSMQQRIDEEDDYMQNFSARREGYGY